MKTNLKYKRYWLRFWFLMADRFGSKGEIFSKKRLPSSYSFSRRFDLNELELALFGKLEKQKQFEYMNMYIHIQMHLKEQDNSGILFHKWEINPFKIVGYFLGAFFPLKIDSFSEQEFQNLWQDFMTQTESSIWVNDRNYIKQVK